MNSERTYCSDLSRAANETMLGTADRVDVWIMVEYKSVWKPKAVIDNDLPVNIQQWLVNSQDRCRERGLKPRPQLIRRPQVETGLTTVMVYREGRLNVRKCRTREEITGIDVLSDDSFDECLEPQYFVCTNGQRDLCCARFGLPTFEKLSEAVGERVWQTTHLGGHRFAPNVLALPQGVLYGRVDAKEVTQFLDLTELGRLSKIHVRGRSAFDPPAQVAELAIEEEILDIVTTNDGEVRFHTTHGIKSVKINKTQEPIAVIASCGDEKTKDIFPLTAQE